MRYCRWEYTAISDEVSIIQPDGCCDIIFVSDPDVGPELRLTQWDDRPRHAQLKAGTTLIGYRLSPGLVLDTDSCERLASDPSLLDEIIEGMTDNNETVNVIDALTEAKATVAQVARQTGVSVRTLQRRFHQLSLPSPEYWRLLGRARRTTRVLLYPIPLAEIATAYGYSDQAHMTREFVRWFGHTPARLRRDGGLLAQIGQPGLGNWQTDNSPNIDTLL